MSLTLAAFLKTIAPSVIKYLGAKGIKFFTTSKYNEYEKELINVLEKTIKNYEATQMPVPKGTTVFYQSAVLLSEIIKFRFTKELSIDEIKNGITGDEKVQIPTSEELKIFLEEFSKNIGESTKLKSLNLQNNYQEEIFNISENLKKLDVIEKLILDIKGELVASKFEITLINEWSTQLDEISSNIEAFKSKTAYDRLLNLEKRINDKGISSNDLKGKLIYLKGSCLNELSSSQVDTKQAELFIIASKLCPTNIEFKVNASFSYYRIEDHIQAKKLADEIIEIDEYNAGGWITRSFLEEQNAIKFLETVPIHVNKKKEFKVHLTHWLIGQGYAKEIKEIDELGLGFDIDSESPPEKITAKNKTYWILITNYLINKFFADFPTLGSAGPSRDAINGKLFLFLREVLEKIVKALEGTEIEDKYVWQKFQYLYMQRFFTGDKKMVYEVEKAFLKIEKKNFHDYLQMFQVFNSLYNEEGTKKAIALVVEYGEEKSEILALFNSYNYLQLQQAENSISAFKKYLAFCELIDERWFFNVLEYITLHFKSGSKYVEDVKKIISEKEFSNEHLKNLYQIHTDYSPIEDKDLPNIKGKLDGIREYVKSDNSHLKYYIASSYFAIGEYDIAASYLKEYIDFESPSDELKLYCIASFKGNSDKNELLKTLKNCRLIKHRDYDLISIEISLLQKISDWDRIIEVVKYGLEIFPDNEFLIYQLFYCFEQLSHKDLIKKELPLLKDRTFSIEPYALGIIGILLRAEHFKESFELLYKSALNPNNKNSRLSYFMSRIHYPEVLFKDPGVSELNTHVKYRYNNKESTVFLTKESVKTLPGKDLLGRRIGEKISYKIPMSNEVGSVEVFAVLNKYNGLLEQIIAEFENPFAGYDLKVIKMDENLTPEEYQKALIKEFGSLGTVNNESIDIAFEKYYTGEISFLEITKKVFVEVFSRRILFLPLFLVKHFALFHLA